MKELTPNIHGARYTCTQISACCGAMSIYFNCANAIDEQCLVNTLEFNLRTIRIGTVMASITTVQDKEMGPVLLRHGFIEVGRARNRYDNMDIVTYYKSLIPPAKPTIVKKARSFIGL